MRILQSMDFDKQNEKDLLTVLGAVLRVLQAKVLFDDAPSHKDSFQRMISGLFFNTHAQPLYVGILSLFCHFPTLILTILVRVCVCM